MKTLPSLLKKISKLQFLARAQFATNEQELLLSNITQLAGKAREKNFKKIIHNSGATEKYVAL